jgi:hypothetical protein
MLRVQTGTATPTSVRMVMRPIPPVVSQVMARERLIKPSRGVARVTLMEALSVNLTRYLIIVLQ